jgi:hypothetical protein
MKAEWTSPLESFSLVAQAKEAYEQKRTRECMALTKALLLTDPTNSEALTLQAAIRTDMQRDMNDARALLEDSRHQEDPQKHRKAAEIILLKILYLDPENEQAKILLSAARASEAHSAPRVARPAPKRQVPPPAEPIPSPVKVVPEVKVEQHSIKIADEHTFERLTESVSTSDADIPFVVAPPAEKKTDNGRRFKVPFIFIIIAVGAVAIFLARQSQSSRQQRLVNAAVAPAPTAVPQTNPLSTDHLFPPPTAPVTTPPATTSSATSAAQPSVVPPVTEAQAQAALKTKVSAAPSPVAYEPANLAAVGPGKLAISSPTSADIYAGDKHLGSTPITLDLPAGTHTLEYRHDNLRTVATHVVKPNETTTALITFEIVVQINSRPWAQVYLDGAQRRALGQTPLSDVKVPIGRILVFENPNFPSKSYRITGKETAIQMVFP